MTEAPYLFSSFVKSSSKFNQLPLPHYPEYAFVGRSNVGKSSLINMLTGKKDLAKTSGKPGKTQLINHFSIAPAGNEAEISWYLVDLPGYGYAKVSKTLRAAFQKLIMPYLEKRENLMCVFVLIDSRHTPQEVDLDFMEKLGVAGIPFAMIFTKADKLKPLALEQNIAKYNEVMLQGWEELPPQFISSSQTRMGRIEILKFIEETNSLFNPPIG